MDDVIRYVGEILKDRIYFVPRGIEEEKIVQDIGQADIFLRKIPSEYWLPQGARGELSTGERYFICADASVKINGQDLCVSGVPCAYFFDFSFIELYRKIKNIGNLHKAALNVKDEFREDDWWRQRGEFPHCPNKLFCKDYVTCSIKPYGCNIAVMIFYIDGKRIFLPLYSCDKKYSHDSQSCCLPPDTASYIEYNAENVHDCRFRQFFITEDLELANYAQKKLSGSDSRCWFSWYGGKDAVRSIDWSIFRNSREVYYVIVRQPGPYFQKACDTAYEIYLQLKRIRVSLKIIYAFPKVAPMVIDSKIFFDYTMEERIPHPPPLRRPRALFDDSFINEQSCTLVYGPRKAGITSLVQQMLRSIKTKREILYVWGVDDPRESRKDIDHNFELLLADNSFDVTSEIGQAYIESKLMSYEYQKRKTIDLLILDGFKSLNKLSQNLEAVDSMVEWLEKLKKLNIAVILVPPGRAWSDKRSRIIKKIPFDNIIRIEKENSYGAHEIVISQHFELIDGVDKFIIPQVWECLHADTPLVWNPVYDKNIEDAAIKYELTKQVKRGAKNKDIALRLGTTEDNIKLIRHRGNLSKKQKNRPQKHIIEMNKHNKNVYKTISKFLKKYSRNVMDILEPRFFDDIIIKFHFDKLSPEEIREKIRGLYGIDFPLSLITKETEEIDKAESWLSRKLDSLYPFLFCNSIPIQSREGGKNFDKTLYLISAVTMSGQKEVLGMWLTEPDNTKFISEIVKSLKERGMQHFLLAFLDESLMEVSSIIKDSFDGGEIQKYLPDLISGTIASVDSKKRKAANADILNMFTACTTQEAEKKLALLIEKWQDESSRITQLHDEFDMLKPLFKYSPETRKFIYSWRTSTLVGNALKELPKNELPTETAVLKVLYREINASGEKVKPVRNWEKIMDELKNHFKVILEKL